MSFGDRISLISLIITLIGFAIGIVKLFRTGKIVRETRQSVLDLSAKLTRYDLLTELNTSIGEMELLKQLNETNHDLAILYARLRRSLGKFRELYMPLDSAQHTVLKECISDLAEIEMQLPNKNEEILKQINNTLIKHMDKLVRLSGQLRHSLGEEHGR
ncbi:MAG: hypothetical protein LBV04_07275 [Deferribacteraceae bacterium]|jgi:hypothetical protein|nr:hypothetical protein [Deferribacteraceae bacterium]